MNHISPAAKPLTVGRFLENHHQPALTLRPSNTVIDAAAAFTSTANGRKHSLAVVIDDNNRVVGVLSLGDIAVALARHLSAVIDKTVGEIMTPEVCAAAESERVTDVMARMREKNIRHMPVIAGGQLKGLITRKDALEGLYDDAQLEVQSLTEFVFRSGARY